MTILPFQHIVRYCIEDVILTIREIFPVKLLMKPQCLQLALNLFWGCLSFSNDERLLKHCAHTLIVVHGKANQTICTVSKEIVVRLYTLKEGCKVIVRITEVIQLINCFAVVGSIHLIL